MAKSNEITWDKTIKITTSSKGVIYSCTDKEIAATVTFEYTPFKTASGGVCPYTNIAIRDDNNLIIKSFL